MIQPKVILDDAVRGRMQAFARPLGIIRADAPEEVPAALAALEAARRMGRYAAGYFSYELGYVLEARLRPLLPENRPVPLMWFGVFDAPAIVTANNADRMLEDWCAGRAYAGPLQYDWTEDEYRERFDRVRALIASGDIYEANLTFGAGFAFTGDPLALYRSLRAPSATPHGAFVSDGEHSILSLSPELFFDIARGRITTRPMKGTAMRAADAKTDDALSEGLRRSVKNRAENLMIVDLIRNDISRIALTGSVEVPKLFAVERYPTVHQMVSDVCGQMREGVSVREIVSALFPCGSVTGAPKIRAMEILRAVEPEPRGVYCGAVGVFAPDGGAHFNVAIRTLTISGDHGRLGVGGAVVYDSTSDDEYAEARLKARYMAVDRQPLELIETLRYAPAEGFVRKRLHLTRMRRSADYFSVRFDETAAEAALQAAVANAAGPLRVRLALDETGRLHAGASALTPNPSLWSFVVSPRRVRSGDVFARHKTGFRALYEGEFARLSGRIGCDEVLFLNERNEVAEGRRTNVFVGKNGILHTPPLGSGALDGCLRRELLESGRAVEAVLSEDDLSGEVYLGNSLRGLIRAVAMV